VFVTDKTL